MYDFSHPEFLYKVQIIWDIFLIHSSVWQKKLANRAAFGSWGPKNVMVFVDALLCSYQGFYIINQGHIGYSSHLINQKCQKSVTHTQTKVFHCLLQLQTEQLAGFIRKPHK